MNENRKKLRDFLKSKKGEELLKTIEIYKEQVALLKSIDCDIKNTEESKLSALEKQRRISNLANDYEKKRHDPKFIKILQEFKEAKSTLSEKILKLSKNSSENFADFDDLLYYRLNYDAPKAYGRLSKIIESLEKF